MTLALINKQLLAMIIIALTILAVVYVLLGLAVHMHMLPFLNQFAVIFPHS